MINCADFYKALEARGVDFFAGVPDSLLADFCAYIANTLPPEKNIIAANEGGAAALCAGWFLGTGNLGCCYMQNSGLGNAANPLISLADPLVYSIPMLLLVGWRGEPGEKDEPQHAKQGIITLEFLKTLGIPCDILEGSSDFKAVLDKAVKTARETSAPYALVVKKNAFSPCSLESGRKSEAVLTREEAIETAAREIGENIIVSTTGKISRELYEIRDKSGGSHDSDFLTVGSMGHSSHIALGIALAGPGRKVFCFDGDGAVLMHQGHLAVCGTLKPGNYYHLLFNNRCHDSVGGQPTAEALDFTAAARAAGYSFTASVSDPEGLKRTLKEMLNKPGPGFLEIKVRPGSRKDLGRPKMSPGEQKVKFMEFIKRSPR